MRTLDDLGEADWDEDESCDDDLYGDDEDDGGEECPYCGEEYYHDAAQCPHCKNYVSREDEPVQPKSLMIWIGFILCISVMALIVVGSLC